MLLSVQFVIKLSRSFSSSSSYHVPQTLPIQTLLKRGFSPTLKSINQFFLFLSQTHRFNLIIHFFSQLKSNRIKSNSKILSIVTRALLKMHKFEEAEYFMTTQVEKSSPLPLSRLWDSLIKGFCIKRKDPEKAFSVLKDCLRNHGILPSSFTFCAIIHCFTSSGNMSRAVEVLELMTSETIKYPFDNFVCSAVISGFCKIEKPELAIGFFENALSSGALRPNVVTYTALVSALCKLDRLNEVGNLVCQMEKEGLEFDVIFYSSWIFGYLREGALMDAFREHGKMMKKGIKPDTISYTLLIDGLSKEANVEKAVGFLTKMIKSGLKPNFVTYTAILQGFCKKGKLEDAITLFKKFGDMGIEVDEFMYATLIDGICKRGDLDYVFHLLADMEKRGIKPSIVTYNTVINGLCKGGRMLEADMVSKGVLGDVVTFSTLLHGYIQEENVNGILETKQRFELAGVSMDAVMCNILLKAQLMVGAFEDAHALYQSMPEMNLHADSVTYCTMIDGYCRVGRIEEALEVFDEFRNTSLSSIACYNCIINALCKKGMLDMAIEVFVELYETGLALDIGVYKKLLSGIFAEVGAEGVLNLVYRLQNLRSDLYDIICNGAISFLCKRGSPEAASEVHMVMRRNGSVVSSKSYYTILKGFHADGKNALFRPFLTVFAKEYGLIQPRVKKMILFYLCMKDVDKAQLFLKRMKENASAVRLPASLFKKLIEDGRALDAYELLMGAEDSLSYMDVVDYTLMVDGLCKGGYPDKAICLCAFAKRKGITLNIITYNSIINGLCRQGCLVEAFRLFDSLERIDLVPSIVTYAILIDYLCKEGFILDAKKLFDRMVLKGFKPNIHVYNSFICGYCKFGQMGEALKLLSDLEVNNLTPDEFTISAIINGCYQKGDMEEALVLFVEFKRKGLSPDFLGFLHLTRGLCNKGRMEEARSILREMLQSKSVGELLSRVDKEVESESIKSFLADLCERGSINEAVTILDEISSIFIPTLGNLSAHHGPKIPHKPYECENSAKVTAGFIISSEKTDLGSDKNDLNKEEVVLQYIDSTGKRSQCRDFGLYYSHINSLCLKGELQQAKRLVKIMLSSMHGNL